MADREREFAQLLESELQKRLGQLESGAAETGVPRMDSRGYLGPAAVSIAIIIIFLLTVTSA